MSVTATYDAQLSRVRLTVDELGDANTVHIERSTDGVRWETVRGGRRVPATDGVARLDDYEFAPGVPNRYRATPRLLESFESATLALTIGGTWTRTQTAAHTGVWSYRSADVDDDGMSEAVVTVPPGASTLTYWRRVSSEVDFDFLRTYRRTPNLLTNPGFETGELTPWSATNIGSAVVSTTRPHTGTYSVEVTPEGTFERCWVNSDFVPVTAGDEVTVAAWVWLTEASTAVSVSVNWFDGERVYLSTSEDPTSVSAATWTRLTHTVTAPTGAEYAQIVPTLAGTPPASNIWFVDEASLTTTTEVGSGVSGEQAWSSSVLDLADTAAVIFRYEKDVSQSEGADAAWIDDLEFAGYPPQTTEITPTLERVWIKSLARPFLNRAVTVTDFSEVERPARNGVFTVVGRTLPVAVTDVRGSRRYELTIVVDTPAAADDLDLCLASGDPVLVHVPPDCPVPRSMYAVVGDLTIERRSVRGPRRYLVLPLTEVAAPAADIVGATITYQGVLATHTTYTDLLAGNAAYADVVERIGEPSEVIVP